jgi:hypothetical protein
MSRVYLTISPSRFWCRRTYYQQYREIYEQMLENNSCYVKSIRWKWMVPMGNWPCPRTEATTRKESKKALVLVICRESIWRYMIRTNAFFPCRRLRSWTRSISHWHHSLSANWLRTLLGTTPHLSYKEGIGETLFWKTVIRDVSKSLNYPPVAVL